MGILRTDIVSHSQLSNTSGSVEFDGTTDFIQVPSSSAWRIGNANGAHKSVTIEWWIYLNTTSGYHNAFDINYTGGLVIEGTNGIYSVYGGGQTLINEGILGAATANRWYHYALVIHGGPASTPKSIFLYRDGKLSGAGKIDSNVALGSSSNNLSIGARQSNGANSLNGFISNFRWSDEVVYNSEFTVPKFNLKALPSTLLLCCQSSTSATEAAVSATGSVTASGNATHSSFNPGLKDDITDTGVVFDGVTTFDSQAFLIPPSGKTTERNRGRGLHAGGENPSHCNIIDFIQIQSGGNAFDFGDLITVSNSCDGVSSKTRAVFATYDAPTYNSLEFVTMATTGNATDFGDQTISTGQEGTLSNDTRGLFAGGYGGAAQVFINTVEFITIPTLGDAQDFGNLREAMVGVGGASDTTRGLFVGGFTPGAYRANIDQFTIATTGDATDFGDLSVARRNPAGTSDSTRGVFFGGNDSGGTNVIDFVTIQSAGNATDFGDSTSNQSNASGASDSIRGVFSAGYYGSPNLSNVIEKVIIQTTGNSVDYGDLIDERIQGGSVSDSHGGLE